MNYNCSFPKNTSTSQQKESPTGSYTLDVSQEILDVFLKFNKKQKMEILSLAQEWAIKELDIKCPTTKKTFY